MDTQHLHCVRTSDVGFWRATNGIMTDSPANQMPQHGKGERQRCPRVSQLDTPPAIEPLERSQIRRQVGARGWFVWEREGVQTQSQPRKLDCLDSLDSGSPSFASCCGLTEVSLMARFHGWATSRTRPPRFRHPACCARCNQKVENLNTTAPRRKWVADHLLFAVNHFILTHRPLLRGCVGCDKDTTKASHPIRLGVGGIVRGYL